MISRLKSLLKPTGKPDASKAASDLSNHYHEPMRLRRLHVHDKLAEELGRENPLRASASRRGIRG